LTTARLRARSKRGENGPRVGVGNARRVDARLRQNRCGDVVGDAQRVIHGCVARGTDAGGVASRDTSAARDAASRIGGQTVGVGDDDASLSIASGGRARTAGLRAKARIHLEALRRNTGDGARGNTRSASAGACAELASRPEVGDVGWAGLLVAAGCERWRNDTGALEHRCISSQIGDAFDGTRHGTTAARRRTGGIFAGLPRKSSDSRS